MENQLRKNSEYYLELIKEKVKSLEKERNDTTSKINHLLKLEMIYREALYYYVDYTFELDIIQMIDDYLISLKKNL